MMENRTANMSSVKDMFMTANKHLASSTMGISKHNGNIELTGVNKTLCEIMSAPVRIDPGKSVNDFSIDAAADVDLIAFHCENLLFKRVGNFKVDRKREFPDPV